MQANVPPGPSPVPEAPVSSYQVSDSPLGPDKIPLFKDDAELSILEETWGFQSVDVMMWDEAFDNETSRAYGPWPTMRKDTLAMSSHHNYALDWQHRRNDTHVGLFTEPHVGK